MPSASILVVEDEPLIVHDVTRSLTQLGYVVAGTVPTGEEAVEATRRLSPDLVLMDIMLAGEMDGARAAALIREQQDVPVVFTTAYADDDTLDRVRPAAPYGYLVKPFDRTLLRVTIETALSRREVEARLAESERRLSHARKMEAVGVLAGGLAHDFNNILSAIIGYSEMALDKLPEADPVRRMVDRIHTAGLRARNMVELLLAFARPATGETRGRADLGEVAAEALQLLTPSLTPAVDLRADLGEGRFPVAADPTRLHQVVMNLLTNAAEAVHGGGVLEVSLAREKGADPESGADSGERNWVRLTVADTGPGIEPEVMERIFDPFFTTKRPGRGTGMGLAVVHGVVRSLGGHVEVESAPGKGSCFTVRLPAAME
jgi:signal transduction histidine kinase